MSALPEVLAAVTLGPDDRLVLAFPRGAFSAAEAEYLDSLLAERGLSGRVLLANGVDDLIVLRATKAEGSTVGQCGDVSEFGFHNFDTGLRSTQWHSCHLADGHSGMHSDGSATWSNEPARAPRCGARRVVMEGPSQRETGSWWCVLPQGHHGNHQENGTEWSDPS